MKKTKKCFMFLLVLLLFFTLVACGNQGSSVSENNSAPQNNNTTTTSNTATSNDDTSFASMLPDHNKYFKNGEVTIIDSDGGTSYCISIKNITKDEYDSYKNACNNGTFSNTTFQSETMFQARNQSEEYYVSLQYWLESDSDDSQNSINITCGIVKK